MKYEVKCTHIISLLKNIKKYENYPLNTSKGEVYIKVYDITEYDAIHWMEQYQSTVLGYYRQLIEATSKKNTTKINKENKEI